MLPIVHTLFKELAHMSPNTRAFGTINWGRESELGIQFSVDGI